MAFLFDIKLEKYKDHYYAINLGKELWENRYFPYFSNIVCICRYREVLKFPNKKQQVDVDGVEVVAFEDQGIVQRLLHLSKEKNEILNILKDCDAVVCRGFWGVRECKKIKKPYLIEVVSCLWDSMWNHSLLGKFAALPMFLSLRHAVRNANFVSYVTEHFLQSRYPTKGCSVGVSDVIIFPSNDEEKQKRYEKIRNLNDDSIIKLGTTAAVNVAYKGQRFVIKALKILEKKGLKNIEYHMAGGGNSESLRKLADHYGVSDRVFFHGSLRHEEVVNFLDNIDIYIQPSLQEGLPRAVVEAMSRGLPCIGSNAGGISELVDKNYICRKTQLTNEIVEKILLLRNQDNMLKMAKYSYDIAEKYKKEKLDDKRELFMQELVNSVKKGKEESE